MLIIEHNLDVIKSSDWIIDLGPEGGDAGGRVVAAGTPEQVARNSHSLTGKFLAPALDARNGHHQVQAKTTERNAHRRKRDRVIAILSIRPDSLRPLRGCSSLRHLGAEFRGRKRLPADPAEVALQNLLTSAQASMEKKDFPSAAQNYRDYLAKKPDVALVHFDLGYAYMSMQKMEDAKGEYEKALSLDPQMAPHT